MRFRHFDSSLSKTLSFAVVHLAIALSLGWLFTGSFVLAGMLTLVEPVLNTFVSHRIGKMRIGEGRSHKQQALLRSGVMGVSHFVVAVGVSLVLGGSFMAASAYAVTEPLANAVAHYFFDLWWERQATRPEASRFAAGAISPRA
jgi:uncharacterized membrane protein